MIMITCSRSIRSLLLTAAVLLAFAAPTAMADVEDEKLIASDGTAGDRFGGSVSVSGDTLVVGAQADDPSGVKSGSVYVFRDNGSAWLEEAKLTASDGAAIDLFGNAVSVSGDSVVIGAVRDDDNGISSGSAYLFGYDGSAWVEEAKFTASDGAAADSFGGSVSISAGAALIGASGDDDNGSGSGSAYIFGFNGTNWVAGAKLTATDGAALDAFGASVSVSTSTIMVGAPGDDDNGSGSGSVYVFGFDGSTWVEDAKLVAADGAAGDSFGVSVSVSDSGGTVVIGARGDDDNGSSSGSAYMFRYDGSSWVQVAKLTASDGAAADFFGDSVSISGGRVVIGSARDDDAGSSSGSAYLFGNDGTGWAEQAKLTASDGAAADKFGGSVAVSSGAVVIGAVGDDDNGSASGSAYVFGVGPLVVEVDVKPDSEINPILPTANGVIPVAILGSDTFDVLDVDLTTLAFGAAGAPIAHSGSEHLEDVNEDGLMDSVSHYRTRQTGIVDGDLEACITGEKFDGTPFEGCDDILVITHCGLGFELALLLPGLMWLRNRKRAN